jgi:hypothetical protein
MECATLDATKLEVWLLLQQRVRNTLLALE